ncbi:MAG: radical SAM protein, partial [Myxococcota bacterium]|nr:radical SAM protein [Myxococcota bacterium]
MSTFVPVNDVCNLGCTFCGIGRRGPRPDAEVMGRLGRVSGGRVTFGGGEPTVDERLPGLLEAARERGGEELVVETNGVRCAEPALVDALVAAGMTGARLMLPAWEPETWGRITGQPDRLDAAWRGGANLLAAGVKVGVVIPVSRGNVDGLDALVGAVLERLSGVSSVTFRPVFYSMPREEGAHAQDIRARA